MATHTEPIGLLLLFTQDVTTVVPPAPPAAQLQSYTRWVEIKDTRVPHRPHGLQNQREW
jgi:hypothetical protein